MFIFRLITVFWLFVIVAVLSCSSTGGGTVDTTQKYEEMLYSVVSIATDRASGSGVVVEQDGDTLYILTVKHLTKKAKHFTVTFYPSGETAEAEFVKKSKDFDLSLLRLKHKHEYVAKLKDPREMNVFEEVWKIGASLSLPETRATKGIVSQINDYEFLIDANIIWGDSGGGIFAKVKGHYVLVGISKSIAMTKHNMGVIPVFHIGAVVDRYAIDEFYKQKD